LPTVEEEVLMKDAAAMARWAARDFVYNLEAIPAEKLDWRPSPEAKSALQMAAEVTGSIRAAMPLLEGRDWEWQGVAEIKSAVEARQAVIPAADEYAAKLESTDASKLAREIQLPFGTFWAARFALFPVIELIHHRGQICYIQSLLGDAEVRFDEQAAPAFFGRPAGE